MPKPIDYKFYTDHFTDAVLDLVENGEKVKTFLLHKPGTTMYSTYICSAPFGIVISGDVRICGNGVISAGYGIGWFTQGLDPRYLAEKFIKPHWQPELAKTYWQECLDEYKAELAEFKAEIEKERAEWIAEFESEVGFAEYIAGCEPENRMLRFGKWRSGFYRKEIDGTIIDALEYLLKDEEYFQSAQFLFDSLPSYRQPDGNYLCPFSDVGTMGGYDYLEGEIGWLVAVQRKFAELYQGTMDAYYKSIADALDAKPVVTAGRW